jgi:hypothetical protein
MNTNNKKNTKEQFRSLTAKVFPVNEQTKTKEGSLEHFAYTEDGKYILVYTNEEYLDLEEKLTAAYNAHKYSQSMNHKTAVLRNAKIEASSKPIKIATVQYSVELDQEKEIILMFRHTGTNMPIYALVAKKDLEKSEGASPLLSSVSIHTSRNSVPTAIIVVNEIEDVQVSVHE